MDVVLPRVVLGLASLALARRARSPRGAALAGAAGAAAAAGASLPALPAPLAFGSVLLVGILVLTALRADLHSPLVSEAAASSLAIAGGAGAACALALAGAGVGSASAGAGAVFAALSVWGAEGARASAEAGWRRGAAWASGAVLSTGVAAGLVALADHLPPRLSFLPAAAASLVSILAWLPALVLERLRVRRELGEEARLGILPEEDLPVLGNPWRRRREPRLGRADERHEYVRSALLLAVARQQQRRRTGEAVRLRQLEVLAFRTRVRRAVEGRGARFAGLSGDAEAWAGAAPEAARGAPYHPEA
ncbi:MAG TPA: hypothetical protein PLP50_07305 [Thermoanaerobaculia bacterium]|nr:hypothetical protein [Thermoanaerobaculia bacterium]HQN07668.1 hypothetical protein [Thermoanaerobaculia bacterium]HQP86136.1 hypothetical protein [Thermoanaerobaculia bacterium]